MSLPWAELRELAKLLAHALLGSSRVWSSMYFYFYFYLLYQLLQEKQNEGNKRNLDSAKKAQRGTKRGLSLPPSRPAHCLAPSLISLWFEPGCLLVLVRISLFPHNGQMGMRIPFHKQDKIKLTSLSL